MSDPQASEPTAPVPPAGTVEPTTPAAAPATPAPAAAAPAVAPEAPVAKKRGVGVWSFVLGLLTVIGDIVLLVVAISVLLGVIAEVSSGDFSGLATAIGAAGLGLFFVASLFGGLVLAGLGALLGLIALITGRGRVIGVIGLLLSAAALTWRIMLLTAGLNVGGVVGG